MKTQLDTRMERGISLFEVLLVIAVLLVLAAIFLPALLTSTSQPRSSRIACVNELKQVGLAFRIWSGDNADKYPMQVSVTNGGTLELVESGRVFPHFQIMSNELSTPKILICEMDELRRCATNFTTDFNDSRISYFVGVDASETNPQRILAGDRNLTVGGVQLTPGLHALPTNAPIGWSAIMHKSAGNVALADGSVQQVTIRGLQDLGKTTGLATNRVVIP